MAVGDDLELQRPSLLFSLVQHMLGLIQHREHLGGSIAVEMQYDPIRVGLARQTDHLKSAGCRFRERSQQFRLIAAQSPAAPQTE